MDRIGPYRVVRTIAVGGMGEVFLASLDRDGGFQKRVAVKRARADLINDPEFVAMFEREARLAAHLDHRHVVQVFDFGRDEGGAWIAMEYVPGVDLKAVLDAGPLPLGIALEIGIACARGLSYAHRARDARGRALQIVHGDISPHNVLLSFEGDIKLADFGLARRAHTQVSGGLRGKIAYLSPEQVDGQVADTRSDQFALGVVLFEMISGCRAFHDDDGPMAILGRVSVGAPLRALRVCAPQIPPALIQVIERAMARSPADRFSNVDALQNALQGISADLPVGQPLGPWLSTHFAPAHDPEPNAEATATAAAPIKATPPPELEPTTQRWGTISLVLILLAMVGASIGSLFTGQPDFESIDAQISDTQISDVLPTDATQDATPKDAVLPDDATLLKDAIPKPRPKPRIIKPKPKPKPEPPVVIPAAPIKPPTVIAVTATSEPKPVPEPQVQVLGRGGARTAGGIRKMIPQGIKYTIVGTGPRVRLRLRQRGQLYLATIDAKPWGQVTVDGKNLGPTAVANVPLREGVRRIRVRAEDGTETRFDVKVMP